MRIDALDVLIGRWRLTGRTDGSEFDDIVGEHTITTLLSGRMLQLAGGLQVGEHLIDSIELIWGVRDGFRSHVYDGHNPPLDYTWTIDGNQLTHAGLGMTYRGTVSADGNTIIGRWNADPDRPDMAHAAYEAIMRRIR
ncbi:hypothetical protein AB0M54_26280 [Actinoplanes sp. NPDC051470]|uniref:hypothetical protein n=1 Tax=unclassified Actinoplanes TaxID=2626549 RepID=UPI00343AAE3E